MFVEALERLKRTYPKHDHVITAYHYFMSWYGYMPFEEFLEMPIPLVRELIELMNEDSSKMKEKMPKVK